MNRNKAVIGGDNTDAAASRALAEQNRADLAAGALTMMQRRIRTFYTEIIEVRFPEDAPSWAPNWVEWLITGEVAKVEEPDTPANDSVPPVV